MGSGRREDARARLGERLRDIRRQQGRSLQDVEDASDGRIKASVLGAYERGERSLSLGRLRELAAFFGMPVGDLLPPVPRREPRPVVRRDEAGVVIDLAALEARRDEVPALARFVEGVRERRGDLAGRVLTVRDHDLDTVAAAAGTTSEGLREELETARLVR